MTHIHGVLNRSQEKKYAIKCSQSNSFYNLTNKIASSRNCKPFNSHRAPVTLQDGYASKSEDDDHSNSFLNVFLKKFHALYRFMRAYACAGVVSFVYSYLSLNQYIRHAWVFIFCFYVSDYSNNIEFSSTCTNTRRLDSRIFHWIIGGIY